jgi:hypothetical protein
LVSKQSKTKKRSAEEPSSPQSLTKRRKKSKIEDKKEEIKVEEPIVPEKRYSQTYCLKIFAKSKRSKKKILRSILKTNSKRMIVNPYHQSLPPLQKHRYSNLEIV